MESSDSHDQTVQDWPQRLAAFLMEQQGVEAVLLDRGHRKVSIATLGSIDEADLKERLTEVLRDLESQFQNQQWPASASSVKSGDVALGIRRMPGDSLLLEKPGSPTAPRLWKWREFQWPEPDQIEKQSREEWQTLAVLAGVCGLGLLGGWLLHHLLPVSWPAMVLYIISMAAGGWDAAHEAWEKIRQKRLDIHFLMLCVAVGAMLIGAWTEGALLLFLFSTSGALEHYALHRTHREINALTKAAPRKARVLLEDGRTEERPVSAIKIGDKLLVRPDELFAVDGTVLEGESASDEANLTGESAPVNKNKGSQVFSGTLNLWGALTIRVDKFASQSSLQRIIALIEHAQHLRAPSERFTDKFGTRYTWFVLGVTTIMFFVWWIIFKLPPFINTPEISSAFYRAMTLLVVMSPCALALSIPSAILAAIAWGARHGILFRGGAAIEKLAEVDVVCMDKTGTLTEGELRVTQVESFPPGREREVASIAFALDSRSNHPISRAISAYGKVEALDHLEVQDFQRITGAGLRGNVNGRVCYVGRRELLSTGDFSKWVNELPDTPLGYSEVWVLTPDLLGRILLLDTLRKDSKPVLDHLKQEGITTVMLTGDRQAAADEIARQLGLSEVRAALRPEDKVTAVQEFTQKGHRVAMVGDGVNDAPSLAAAYVSVAMGARGSDAALEQSDVVLMKDDIARLVTARDLSLRARAIIRQNLAISLGAIALASLASLGGWLQLTAGVIAHEGSTVIVCLNSLRLLIKR